MSVESNHTYWYLTQWPGDEWPHDVALSHTLWLWNFLRQRRDITWSVTFGFQVCCVYSYFNFMIRLQNVIMFSSLRTLGECESGALELLSGPYLRCARRALGKRSEAVTVERLLFHMTDFPNCSKMNLWKERKAAAVAGWEDSGCLRGDMSLLGFCQLWRSVWEQPDDLESPWMSPLCVPVSQNC